jgi:hypothetical protein
MKAKFTPEEDARLREVVERCGTSDWSVVAREMFDRKPRQCRERWNNYVNPVIVSSAWSLAEDQLLETKFNEIGARWKEIAQFFPTRSKNQVKYRWMTKQKNALSALQRTVSASQKLVALSSPTEGVPPHPPQDNGGFEFLEPSETELHWGNISPHFFQFI